MTKQFWVNLPVKDIDRSKVFFTALGFTFNTTVNLGPDRACLLIGESKVAVMLFTEPAFLQCIRNEGPVAKDATEVLLSIDAESKEEVDEMVSKAIEAGGASNHKPAEMTGWMYGCMFTDPDGHRWNVLYMDPSKMKQG